MRRLTSGEVRVIRQQLAGWSLGEITCDVYGMPRRRRLRCVQRLVVRWLLYVLAFLGPLLLYFGPLVLAALFSWWLLLLYLISVPVLIGGSVFLDRFEEHLRRLRG